MMHQHKMTVHNQTRFSLSFQIEHTDVQSLVKRPRVVKLVYMPEWGTEDGQFYEKVVGPKSKKTVWLGFRSSIVQVFCRVFENLRQRQLLTREIIQCSTLQVLR